MSTDRHKKEFAAYHSMDYLMYALYKLNIKSAKTAFQALPSTKQWYMVKHLTDTATPSRSVPN